MADEDYRRLTPACFCGAPIQQIAGRGRPRKTCATHFVKKVPAVRPELCKQCGTAPVPAGRRLYCSKACTLLAQQRKKHRPLAEHLADRTRSDLESSCEWCKESFRRRLGGRNAASGYVNRWCSLACMRLSVDEAKRPRSSLWVARYCAGCGQPGGERRNWETCQSCTAARQAESARASSRRRAEEWHKAAGRVVECNECGASYCPLYGSKSWRGRGSIPLCSVCAPKRVQQHKLAAKAKRRALARGAAAEAVCPVKLFERDGWVCYLCGRDTPPALRGTTDGRAPEVEHVEPLARGGAHTWANTRCACRRCNGIKGDLPLSEAMTRIRDAIAFG